MFPEDTGGEGGGEGRGRVGRGEKKKQKGKYYGRRERKRQNFPCWKKRFYSECGTEGKEGGLGKEKSRAKKKKKKKKERVGRSLSVERWERWEMVKVKSKKRKGKKKKREYLRRNPNSVQSRKKTLPSASKEETRTGEKARQKRQELVAPTSVFREKGFCR